MEENRKLNDRIKVLEKGYSILRIENENLKHDAKKKQWKEFEKLRCDVFEKWDKYLKENFTKETIEQWEKEHELEQKFEIEYEYEWKDRLYGENSNWNKEDK